jgi:hypothetical protein
MPSRIEHDNDAALLRLMFRNTRAKRDCEVDQFEEAWASIFSGAQVVDGDVQVHTHLLLAGDGRPHRWHKRLLPLKLELLIAGRRPHKRPCARHGLGPIDNAPSQQRCIELGHRERIRTAENGST